MYALIKGAAIAQLHHGSYLRTGPGLLGFPLSCPLREQASERMLMHG